MELFKPSVVVTSAPAGGVIIYPLIMMIPMLTILPTTKPAKTAKMFLRIGFIMFELNEWSNINSNLIRSNNFF